MRVRIGSLATRLVEKVVFASKLNFKIDHGEISGQFSLIRSFVVALVHIKYQKVIQQRFGGLNFMSNSG